jgi:hypothetical protein
MGIEDGDTGVPYLGEVWPNRHTAQGQEVVSASLTPKHAGLFESSTDDGFTARFDHPAADKVALLTKISVAGSGSVGLEIGDFAGNGLDSLRRKIWEAFHENGFGTGDERLAAVLFHLMTPVTLLRFGFRACIQECGSLISGVFAGDVEDGDVAHPGCRRQSGLWGKSSGSDFSDQSAEVTA